MPRPALTPSKRRRWWLGLVATLLLATSAHAQTIGRGREADVLRLFLPFVDEGPVGEAKLARVAIHADRIDVLLQTPDTQSAHLTLRPRDGQTQPAGARSFVVETPPAPTPALTAAQNLLRDAIVRNDAGTFFAAQETTTLPAPPAPALSPAQVSQLFAVSDALWVLLLVLSVAALLRGHVGVRVVAWLLVAVAGALVRRHVPFAPLHANGHGLEELTVVLSGPDAQAATARYLAQYGASWLVPLRTLTGLATPTHDQVGIVSSALGGLAAMVGMAAAWRISRKVTWTLLAGALLVWSPVAARVGHSESAFVTGQLLVAVALLVMAGQRGVERAVFAVSLTLLALGHPVALVVAGGLWLLSIGVQGRAGGWRWPLLSGLALAVAAGVQLAGSHAGVADRLTEQAHFHLPVPGLAQNYLLWLHTGFAPVLTIPVATLGLWQLRRWQTLEPELWRVLPLLLGALAMVGASLLVTACVSDGLRYQSLLAPLFAFLLAASAPAWAERRVWGLIAWVGIAWGLTGLAEGRRLDAQAQSYVALRAALAQEHGEIALVVPERRPDGHERVVVELPQGKLAADGPTLVPLQVSDVVAGCKAGRPPPVNARIWLDAACSADTAAGEQPPCASLARLAGDTLKQAQVQPLPRLGEGEMAGEFQNFGRVDGGVVLVRLARVTCGE